MVEVQQALSERYPHLAEAVRSSEREEYLGGDARRARLAELYSIAKKTHCKLPLSIRSGDDPEILHLDEHEKRFIDVEQGKEKSPEEIIRGLLDRVAASIDADRTLRTLPDVTCIDVALGTVDDEDECAAVAQEITEALGEYEKLSGRILKVRVKSSSKLEIRYR